MIHLVPFVLFSMKVRNAWIFFQKQQHIGMFFEIFMG